MTIFRWIIFIPAGIGIALLFGNLFVYARRFALSLLNISQQGFISNTLEVLESLVLGFMLTYFSTRIAPGYHKTVSIIVCGIIIFVFGGLFFHNLIINGFSTMSTLNVGATIFGSVGTIFGISIEEEIKKAST